MLLLIADTRISKRANFSPTPTTAYNARVRVSHENANVPPSSPFEAGREIYMGERYLDVTKSWEYRYKDWSTDNTLSTLASTQVGEDTSEIYVVLNLNPVQVPASVTTDSPPSKRTKSTACLLRQSLLDSFLIVDHTPSPTEKSHPPPDIPLPPQTPHSKKQRSLLTIPSLQSSIKTFFSPTPGTKRKNYSVTSPQSTQPPPQSLALTEDTVIFAEADIPIDKTTPTSDDILRRPFSVDYITKYNRPIPGGEDSYLHDAELDEVSSNAWRHEYPEDELLFTEIDARYAHSDGLLGKELPDWQEDVDTSPHHQRLEWTKHGGNFTSGDGYSVRTVPPMEERLSLTSPTSLPHQTLEQSSTGAPKSDDSRVLEADEEQGAGTTLFQCLGWETCGTRQ